MADILSVVAILGLYRELVGPYPYHMSILESVSTGWHLSMTSWLALCCLASD